MATNTVVDARIQSGDGFFTGVIQFMADNQNGFIVIFAVLFALAFLIQWVCWIFGTGRFKRPTPVEAADGQSRSSIRLIVADLFVKVIDDFRHLLALIIVVLFATALIYVLIISQYGDATKIAHIKDAMQAVTGTLSGIIGVILGYYFGESSGRAKGDENLKPGDPGDVEQSEDEGGGDAGAAPSNKPVKSSPAKKTAAKKASTKKASVTKSAGVLAVPPPPPPPPNK